MKHFMRLGVLATGVLLASGCSLPGTGACTLIGCQDGLMVLIATDPVGPWTVQVAAPGGAAASIDCPANQRCGGAFFAEFTATTVNVTVTVNGKTGQHDNLTPTPRTTRPNGPRCEPTCSQPFVTVPLPQ